jgi:hypothetical protein
MSFHRPRGRYSGRDIEMNPGCRIIEANGFLTVKGAAELAQCFTEAGEFSYDNDTLSTMRLSPFAHCVWEKQGSAGSIIGEYSDILTGYKHTEESKHEIE